MIWPFGDQLFMLASTRKGDFCHSVFFAQAQVMATAILSFVASFTVLGREEVILTGCYLGGGVAFILERYIRGS
jgi:hypothetical protein